MTRRPGTAFLFAKRAIDLAGASLASIVLLPVVAVICIVVKLGSPGPVLFRQRRLGKNGVPFTLYKFRTMRDGAPMLRNADGSAFVGAGDPRLTRAGRFLRDSTLDEIPQLINVLRGDMSLVGPRPLVPDEDAKIFLMAFLLVLLRRGVYYPKDYGGEIRN